MQDFVFMLWGPAVHPPAAFLAQWDNTQEATFQKDGALYSVCVFHRVGPENCAVKWTLSANKDLCMLTYVRELMLEHILKGKQYKPLNDPNEAWPYHLLSWHNYPVRWSFWRFTQGTNGMYHINGHRGDAPSSNNSSNCHLVIFARMDVLVKPL